MAAVSHVGFALGNGSPPKSASGGLCFILKFGLTGFTVLEMVRYLRIRPPDIHVGGLRFYRDSSSFFRHIPSELAERNSTKTDHMIGSECDLKMYVRILRRTPFPYKSGVQNHLFSTTSQSNGKFNGLYLRSEI